MNKKSLSKLKKYYDYDDIEHKGIGMWEMYLVCQLMRIKRDVGNVFSLSINGDYRCFS